MTGKIEKSDEEWRVQLTPEQYHITRQKGTNALLPELIITTRKKGTYHCVGCGAEVVQFGAEV
jgi:peptide-methionine (R)-S-oxide reductase